MINDKAQKLTLFDLELNGLNQVDISSATLFKK